MSETLTKKQQKAQAFRSKQKAKKGGRNDVVPEDVPEQDLVNDEEVAEDTAPVDAPPAGETSKKRKRADEAGEPEAAKSTVKGKGKAKTAWDEEGEEGDKAAAGKKSKKEIKQRFILFVGNLGFKTTREEVQAHFTEAAGNKPAVRLLTTKPAPKSSEPPKSRGIAFLELPSSDAMQACLKLHHSMIAGRRINVELTAGGGGKSEGRVEKIKARNERVGGQRERRAEKEREAAIEAGEPLPVPAGQGSEDARKRGGKRREQGDEPRTVEVVRADGEGVNADGEAVKVRGGRRIKVKAKNDDGRPPKRTRSENAGHGSHGGPGGDGRRRGDHQGGGRPPFQQQQGGRGFRPKWEPTGANAVTVG